MEVYKDIFMKITMTYCNANGFLIWCRPMAFILFQWSTYLKLHFGHTVLDTIIIQISLWHVWYPSASKLNIGC